MNAEYQRLEAEASEVQNQIDELVRTCGQMLAADFQKFEAEIAGLHQRLAGLRQGMGLLKLAGSAKMQAQAAKLAKCQPKTFHSPSTHPKTVQLTGGVTVVKVSGDAAGRRIVVTTDGGRVRLREKRRGKTKKGHKRFKSAWREPRLFMIYATDAHGKLDPAFSPIIDGSLGLTAEQTQQRIDYWHAVEYLGKIVESSSLHGKQKSQWRKTQKNRLYRGDIGLVIIAIENAVRRVINLRVKSNATYWLRENAETIIRFRAWIKAGRAEELFHQTTYVTPELAV